MMTPCRFTIANRNRLWLTGYMTTTAQLDVLETLKGVASWRPSAKVTAAAYKCFCCLRHMATTAGLTYLLRSGQKELGTEALVFVLTGLVSSLVVSKFYGKG
jgi:hypothetical protein